MTLHLFLHGLYAKVFMETINEFFLSAKTAFPPSSKYSFWLTNPSLFVTNNWLNSY
ncbi:hypothetical protein HYE21_01045 [Mycoplasmopsis bovis]|nr:hypothetical protein [Mycoplasmopsis bovis]QQH24295.1 hypothetical protein HYE21_01045 [Mycoplasmopsis bovis]